MGAARRLEVMGSLVRSTGGDDELVHGPSVAVQRQFIDSRGGHANAPVSWLTCLDCPKPGHGDTLRRGQVVEIASERVWHALCFDKVAAKECR